MLTERAPFETYLCRCLQITRAEVEAAIEFRACQTLSDIAEETGAGSGCTCCHRCIRDLLAARQRHPNPAHPVQAVA